MVKKEGEIMNTLNIILLVIGILIFILGVIWSKESWTNVFIKLLLIASGVYLGWYALYLSNILIVINK